MQVSRPFKQLLRVLLDVSDIELDLGVFEETCEIVIHVREHHERLTDLEVGDIGCAWRI
jgi:hypothetical protein